MPLVIVILGICLLLVLILVFKFNSFLSFVIVSLAVGLAEGMTIDKTVISIENGIGTTMGFLVLVLGFGSMLGKLVSESGAAQRITSRLVSAFGLKHIQLALMLTGFIVGISLFYDVGISTVLDKSGLGVFGASTTNTLIESSNRAVRSSTGLEISFMLPMVNAPFRLIFAYNPQAYRATVMAGLTPISIMEPRHDIKFTIGRSF